MQRCVRFWQVLCDEVAERTCGRRKKEGRRRREKKGENGFPVEHTRSLSSSQPNPPAPITRILTVSASCNMPRACGQSICGGRDVVGPES